MLRLRHCYGPCTHPNIYIYIYIYIYFISIYINCKRVCKIVRHFENAHFSYVLALEAKKGSGFTLASRVTEKYRISSNFESVSRIGTSNNADWFARCMPITCVGRAKYVLFLSELMAKYENYGFGLQGGSVPPHVDSDKLRNELQSLAQMY